MRNDSLPVTMADTVNTLDLDGTEHPVNIDNTTTTDKQQSVAESSLYVPTGVKSKVWEHFKLSGDPNEKGKAFCNICKKGFTCKSGNTSALAKHLRRTHYITIELNSGSSSTSMVDSGQISQLTLPSLIKRKTPFATSDKQAQKISLRIAMLICKDLQPIRIVEDAGFKELIEYLEPRYAIVGRKYLTEKALPALYNECCRKLREVIEAPENKAMSLTTDAWTSRATANYVTVTLHVLDAQWSFCLMLLLKLCIYHL